VKLYIDDDSCDKILIAMLRKAGNDIVIPADVGMSGRRDPEHLLQSVQDDRALLSMNYKDFEPLHHLVVGCSGSHRGIILIRRVNDPRKNLTNKGIVSALAKLERAYPDLTNELITLNDWR
jgi:hypothetical protein